MSEVKQSDWEQVFARLDAVEKRLSALEVAVQPPQAKAPHVLPPIPECAPRMTPPAAPFFSPMNEPAPDAAAFLETSELPDSSKAARFAAYAADRAPVPVISIESEAPISSGPAPRSLESRIGQNWASIIGALAVVLAALFFLKYAWDEGWLELSPGARIVAALIAGVGLLGAGQWTHRKRMQILAATLSGAGVAVMMAACFAAKALFDPPVISTPTAFAGVAVAAALGILISLQIDSLAVALVALIGAYIAPIVLGSHRDQSLGLMGYLAALAIVGWVLSFLRPHWPSLRWFVWCCSGLWIALWLMRVGLQPEHQSLALAAVAFFFAGTLSEGLAAAARSKRADPYAWQPIASTASPATTIHSLDEAIAALSLLNTAAAFAGCFVILDHLAPARTGLLSPHPSVAVALLLAALHAAIAWLARGTRISQSSMIQAAALFTLAVPLSFGRLAITLAWLLLAISLATLAAFTGNRPIRIWTLILLGLGLMRLVLFDALDPALTTMWFTVADQPISRWLLVAWSMAGMFHAVAWLLVVPAHKQSAVLLVTRIVTIWAAGVITAAIGSAIFLIASALYWTGLPLTLLAIAWVIPILALHRAGARLALFVHAAVITVIIAVKWLLQDNLSQFFGAFDPQAAAPLFNLSTLAGLALAGLFAALGLIARRSQNVPASRNAIAASLGVVFAILNFETLRTMDALQSHFADPATAKQVALSVLWATVGLAAVIVGFARKSAPLRYAALGLLGVTLAKVLLFDLAGIKPVYRVLSFLAVGIMLLSVSFVYHRQAQNESTTPTPLP